MPEMKDKKFSKYFYNRISYLGVILSIVVAIGEVFLFGIDLLIGYSNNYLSLFSYMILPPFLIIGLLLIPLGAWLERRRSLSGRAAADQHTFFIDLSNPSHRNACIIFFVGTILFLLMTAVGSYKAFHYTESVAFCGTTCHTVMKPEYTAYLQSPHARVKCVDCHIGSGVSWYMHSKLSGLRQVVKTIRNDFDRPIGVPVRDLRPAKDTCEECHWPGKSFSAIELNRSYFPVEPGETDRWNLSMLMKVSGSDQGNYGIHAHMNNNNSIFYVADDDMRQKISWVKSVGNDGGETVYTSPDSPYLKMPPPAGKVRKMDCMDCHSRPSHHFQAPVPLVDRAMAAGKISVNIPQIKAKAVEVMARKYATEEEGVNSIRNALLAFYKEKHSAYFAAHQQEIEESIEGVIFLYKTNFFPEMKVRWEAYPDNIGHMISDGCFRCHDDQHKSSAGKTITRDCDSCHSIIRQGPSGSMEKDADGLPFKHPFDGSDESWKEMNCTACHTGS